MNKTIATFLAVSAMALSLQSQAQTILGQTNTNTVVQGASSTTVKSQYTRIEGGSAVTIAAPNTEVIGTLRVTGPINAAIINVASPHGTLNVGNQLVNTKDTVIRNDVASIDRDAGLSNRITDETAARVAGDTDTLNSANTYTDNKVSTINTAVTNLTGTVSANATTAATATAVVQTNLDSERDARIAGNQQLSGRIDSTNNSLAQSNQNFANEVVERKARDAEHTTSIQKNTNAIAAESNRAQQAEAALSRETKQVGAMAMAAAAVAGAVPVGDKKTAVSAAVGGYSGHTAIAVGVTHMVKPNVRTFGAFSKVQGGKTGVAVGASFSF